MFGGRFRGNRFASIRVMPSSRICCMHNRSFCARFSSGFVSGVNSFVDGKARALRKRFLAYVARRRTVDQVYEFVSVEVTAVHEGFAAHVADIWPFARVVSFVYCEVGGIDKALVADVAGKRSQAGVGAYVDFQGPTLAEPLVANVTLVLFLVDVYSFVSGEVCRVDERLTA